MNGHIPVLLDECINVVCIIFANEPIKKGMTLHALIIYNIVVVS